jgi:hypothetical protein
MNENPTACGSPWKKFTAEDAMQKKSATIWGCAKVPPKEEDLEECADTLREHQHDFIMPPRFSPWQRLLLLCSRVFVPD